jgi:tetratricopeptide (TPR) repeat protein
MKRLSKILLIFIALAGFSAAGYSQDDSTYQAEAIASGKLVEAEQGLLAILEKDPNDPYALLNLAFVYQKSGDTVKSQQVYQRILELKNNPYAELASGKPEPVKTIARRGIAKLEAE